MRRELTGNRTAAETGELELQSRWFAGEFGREFQGADGESVRVIQFGVWNHCSGPDFTDAAVSINQSPPVKGDIEIDPDARDWERHGHSENPAYENVVLHIFETSGSRRCFTRTANHKLIVQVQLNPKACGPSLTLPLAHCGRCAPLLGTVPLTQLKDVLLEAANFRFKRKAKALTRMAEVHSQNESLYQALAMGLGYPNNQLPFRLLAQRLPLLKVPTDPKDTEAILFGLSGLLPMEPSPKLDEHARRYLKGLWSHWWKHRSALLNLILPAHLWNLRGQRPANHPLRRIGTLATLIHHWKTIKSTVTKGDWKTLGRILQAMRHPFWSHHHTFLSSTSTRPLALLGSERINELMVNTLLPFAGRWETFLNLKTSSMNLKARIASARLLAQRPDAREILRNAAFQQGLLELYEAYCCKDASDCKQCPFPEQTLHHFKVSSL